MDRDVRCPPPRPAPPTASRDLSGAPPDAPPIRAPSDRRGGLDLPHGQPLPALVDGPAGRASGNARQRRPPASTAVPVLAPWRVVVAASPGSRESGCWISRVATARCLVVRRSAPVSPRVAR